MATALICLCQGQLHFDSRMGEANSIEILHRFQPMIEFKLKILLLFQVIEKIFRDISFVDFLQ